MEVIGTEEAAKLVGVTRDRIYYLILRGKIKGYKIGNSWGVDKATLLEWFGNKKLGRPRRKKRRGHGG